MISAKSALSWFVVAGTLIGPSCDALDSEPDAPQADGTIRYRLAWDVSGVEPLGSRFSLVNDLGVTIVTEQGYLTSYSMQLVECPNDEESHVSWGGLFGVRTAHAGHSSDAADPVAFEVPLVETLTHDSTDLEFGTVPATGLSYCDVHYLAGRGNDETRDRPDDGTDMERTTLYLSGTWQGQNDAQPTAFELRTALAGGMLLGISTLEAPNGATITVTRDLAGLFDGLNFAAMDDTTLAQTILLNLVDDLSVDVR